MKSFDEIKKHLQDGKSFVLEAGAGSGKTYTLIQTLNYLIETNGEALRISNQRIVCITYTNVAKNEIIGRIENNDLVIVSTIHQFLWDTIKQYQNQLKRELCILNERYFQEEYSKIGESRYLQGLASRISLIESVAYNDTTFNDFEKGFIEHDDVIELSNLMYEKYPLLTTIVSDKYPFIFIDEYQDTAVETITCLVDYLLLRNHKKQILGFFGDSHQRIYDSGVGDLEKYYATNGGVLELVKKEENFRSSQTVVRLLNNFRKNIQQVAQKQQEGSARFFYWDSHPNKPSKAIKEFNDRVSEEKNKLYDTFLEKLISEHSNQANPEPYKVLVLANSRVAQRAGFGELYKIFNVRYGQRTKEMLMDRTHQLIIPFVGTIDKKTSQEVEAGIEHLLAYWNDDNSNEVIRFIKKYGSVLSGNFSHDHKRAISMAIEELVELRMTASIGEVYAFMTSRGLLKNLRLEEYLRKLSLSTRNLTDDDKTRFEKDNKLKHDFFGLPYTTILKLWEHLRDNSVFSTKHGTKGEQFMRVLSVIDDTEWVAYNFKNFFNGSETIPKRYLRTRNLFYVECSRAMEDLVVLCLSDLDGAAQQAIRSWFGSENVFDIEEYLK